MLLKTILNKCQKFKCFVYGKTRIIRIKGKDSIEVTILPRKNSKAICSCCEKEAPLYDKAMNSRLFEFISIWGFPVYFLYQIRRVECKNCQIKVEKVPWAKGKNTLTSVYMQFLANWAKKLSWKEVAISFNTTWDKVCRAVMYIVNWGLNNRDLSEITAIGVDEVQWQGGHKYLTLVYQIDAGMTRLLWIAKDRTEKAFSEFFDFLV